jgi:hypothetical protein
VAERLMTDDAWTYTNNKSFKQLLQVNLGNEFACVTSAP